ncbi:MAG: FAD/NAD(P)-binding protein [Desulfobacterales bacterium]|nr:FAD/NAD(P)-binding protein [Desulfobacterales bacterium]
MLIIGGGIHGVHLAHRLLHDTWLTHDDIRILDPHEELLHEWRRCTRNCGMQYLRSPAVHHIDIDPFSLDKYAALAENRQDANFIPPKDRPSVELFDRHCQMVLDDHRLKFLHLKGRALKIQKRIGHVSVVTAEETIHARFVLFALGMGGQPLWPHWADHLSEQGVMVNHVFDPGFWLKDIQADGPVAVIGAGISGGQLALHLIEKGFESVLLVSSKAIQVSDFDFDPGWLGPKYLDRFHRQSNDQRRQQIMAARAKGSVPRDIKLALDKATALNQLTCIVDDIIDAKCQNGGALLIGRHGRYDCQKIVLATGFTENRPGNGFISQAIKEFDLKTAACGFPVIEPTLQWHERIFVTGPLSELQIGPSARNIAGARHSGRRITAAFSKESIP